MFFPYQTSVCCSSEKKWWQTKSDKLKKTQNVDSNYQVLSKPADTIKIRKKHQNFMETYNNTECIVPNCKPHQNLFKYLFTLWHFAVCDPVIEYTIGLLKL